MLSTGMDFGPLSDSLPLLSVAASPPTSLIRRQRLIAVVISRDSLSFFLFLGVGYWMERKWYFPTPKGDLY